MMWHVVCGDVAAQQLSPLVEHDDGVHMRVLRDDLAVGPLRDVDSPLCTLRADFWHCVWPEEARAELDLAPLSSDVRWLQTLSQQQHPVTVWHGDSASEQLMLARVAFWLDQSPAGFREVNCGTGASHTGGRRAVSMCSLEQLGAFEPQGVSSARRRELADVWAAQRASSAMLRRWHGGQFLTSDYEVPDTVLLAACDSQWRPLARVMAAVMKEASGYFPTDYFIYWRARELATQGRVVIDGDTGQGCAGLQVHRPG